MLYFNENKEEPLAPVDMSRDEFLSVARKLEEFNSVFSELWRMGIPIMADNYGGRAVNTAEVHFDSKKKAIKVYINPYLWERLDKEQRLFIICHECLHVVFNYGFRVMALDNADIANVAADVAINQILEKNFRFDRKEVDPCDELCWQDSGFLKKIDNVEPMQTLEYYYGLLNREMSKSDGGESGDMPGTQGDQKQFILGSHGDISDEDQEAMEELCKQLNETLSVEEKESMKELIEKHFEDDAETSPHTPGTSAGGIWVFVEKELVKPKKKWETVIKKWANTQIKEDRRSIEQWVILNRRFSLLPRDLLIPSEMEMDTRSEEKKKIEVWFFQDTSGSCSGYTKRFFQAAESLPPNRFDIKMHCFDTKVYETTLKSRKLYGYGGTSFHPIESYILSHSKAQGGYPKAVFVITDGYGTRVNPKHPDKWYIFLTPGGRKTDFPKECNFFNLENFE